MSIHYVPKPVIDTLQKATEQYKAIHDSSKQWSIINNWLNTCFENSKIKAPNFAKQDYRYILSFLYQYRGSNDTFNAYRRDLERLLQWSWFVRDKSIMNLKREDIEVFIEFCIKPYRRWIGLKTLARFKTDKKGLRKPNSDWRPFDVNISKQAHKEGIEISKDDFEFSQQALKSMFAISSSFYNYLLQEEIIQSNPVALIRQKSKFIQKTATQPMIRRLSETAWKTVIELAEQAADSNTRHERDLFILTCFYSLYLRISEIIAKPRWTPTMGDFFKDNDGNWWLKVIGKGNKERQIAVSPAMLNALKRYRKNYLDMSPLPIINEKTPLISHIKNHKKSITSQRPIRQLVQTWFDKTIQYLSNSGKQEDSDALKAATVHWLRHTGISDDVKIRPREHVRDDAGHSSSAITDRYIDVELKERAKSARKKKITD